MTTLYKEAVILPISEVKETIASEEADFDLNCDLYALYWDLLQEIEHVRTGSCKCNFCSTHKAQVN
jgi:hypothetical protein